MPRTKATEQDKSKRAKHAKTEKVKSTGSVDSTAKQRKKYRRKRIKSQIRKLQRHGELLVSKAGFKREVIRALDKINPSMLITSNAVKALQASAESALTNLFIDANKIAVKNANRVSPLVEDLETAVELGHRHFISKF